MKQLAEAVSRAEGLAKPLVWQTVQQWESGVSAPKRVRMATVARLLELDMPAAALPPVFTRQGSPGTPARASSAAPEALVRVALLERARSVGAAPIRALALDR